jgi:hypothetical protein
LTFKRWSSLFCLRAWRTVRGHRADCPRGAVRQVVLRVRHMFLSAFISIRLAICFWPGEVWWTVHATLVAREPSDDRAQTVHYSRCATRGSIFIFGQFVCDLWTIRPYHADRPPGHRGLSAWCLAELLSSLLLVLHFRFGIVWCLFLGLVGPL